MFNDIGADGVVTRIPKLEVDVFMPDRNQGSGMTVPWGKLFVRLQCIKNAFGTFACRAVLKTWFDQINGQRAPGLEALAQLELQYRHEDEQHRGYIARRHPNGATEQELLNLPSHADWASAKNAWESATQQFNASWSGSTPLLSALDEGILQGMLQQCQQVLATSLHELARHYDLGTYGLTFFVHQSMFDSMVLNELITEEGELKFLDGLAIGHPEDWTPGHRSTGFALSVNDMGDLGDTCKF
jgi:hypothetical protein